MNTSHRSPVLLLILLAILLGLLFPATSPAQQPTPPTIRISIVTMDSSVTETLGRAYATVRDREQLWCVARYTIEERADFTLLTVTHIMRDTTPENVTAAHQDVYPSSCRYPIDSATVRTLPPSQRPRYGLAMPMIHTHPSGTWTACQPSPRDVAAILSRLARFDGIVCGPRQATWQFSRDYLAVLTIEAQKALPVVRE